MKILLFFETQDLLEKLQSLIKVSYVSLPYSSSCCGTRANVSYTTKNFNFTIFRKTKNVLLTCSLIENFFISSFLKINYFIVI